MLPAVWKGSSNYWAGRDNNKVVAIVDHIIVGSIESANGWFNNPQSEVSAHFGVAKDGRVWQWVSTNDTAWANGKTEQVDQSVPWLVNAVNNKVNPNSLTVSIEHEGNTGDVFPEAQYLATLSLHRMLVRDLKIIPDRQHIIGHYQVMKFQKANCPGKGFPWTRLMGDLAVDSINDIGSSPAPAPAPTLPDGFTLDNSGHNAAGAIIDSTTGNLILQPFADYWLNNGSLEVFGRPLEYGAHGSVGEAGSVVCEFKYAHMYLDKTTRKVVVEMKDRNNPQGFKVGFGMLQLARSSNYIFITSEQWFTPDANQPGLGKMSRAWVQDKDGKTLVLMASEMPELTQPGQDTPWKVEVLEVM